MFGIDFSHASSLARCRRTCSGFASERAARRSWWGDALRSVVVMAVLVSAVIAFGTSRPVAADPPTSVVALDGGCAVSQMVR